MDVKQQVQQQFGKNAHHYVTSEIHAKGKDLGVMISISDATKQDIVLDIATGGGHVANGFAPLVHRVVALDLTENMLKKAEDFIKGNGNANVEFVQGDAEHLPFEDCSFSIVACRIAPHHFPNITSFIKESYRVLKEDGTFLLIDNVAPEKEELDEFFNTVEKKRDYSHHRAWKKSKWIAELEIAGFVINQFVTFPKTFQFNSYCDRMALPVHEKNALETFMFESSQEIHRHFDIQVENGHLKSFQAQSVLIKCKK